MAFVVKTFLAGIWLKTLSVPVLPHLAYCQQGYSKTSGIILWTRRPSSRSLAYFQQGNESKSKKWRVSMIFLFLPCVATFGLGTWQLFRRQWKIEVLEYRRKRLEEEPIPISAAVPHFRGLSGTMDLKSISNQTAIEKLEFRKVICEGVYHDNKNIYVGPRGRSSFGVTKKGYYVITPLTISDGSKSVQDYVLVNRGWVPSEWISEASLKGPSLPVDATTVKEEVGGGVPWWNFWTRQRESTESEVALQRNQEETVKVHGVVRGSEKPNIFVPLNVPKAGQWFYIDVPAMVQTLGLPENTILIEAVQQSKDGERITKETFPVAKDVEALLNASVMPQDHINYAITWYSLSAATTFMAVKRIRGSRKGI